MADTPTVDPIAMFSENVQAPVSGLAFLGNHSKTVNFAGHRFGLQTLRPEYRYAIGRIIQPYRNTMVEVDVWRNAHVATALTHVDGNYKFCEPINEDIETFVQGRLNYVSNRETGWSRPLLDYLYEQWVLVEFEAVEAIKELNDFLAQNTGKPFSSSPVTFNSPDTSTDETDSDSESFPTFNDPFSSL